MITFKNYIERKVWLNLIKAKFNPDEADNLIVDMRNRNEKLAALDERWDRLRLEMVEKGQKLLDDVTSGSPRANPEPTK